MNEKLFISSSITYADSSRYTKISRFLDIIGYTILDILAILRCTILDIRDTLKYIILDILDN